MTPAQVLEVAGPVADALAPALSRIAPAWEAVRAHPIMTLGALLLSSGAGANLLVRGLNRVPLGPWYAAVRLIFLGVSRAGNTRLGRPLWEPFEVWLENFICKTADAAREGLEADDAPVTGGQAAPQGPA